MKPGREKWYDAPARARDESVWLGRSDVTRAAVAKVDSLSTDTFRRLVGRKPRSYAEWIDRHLASIVGSLGLTSFSRAADTASARAEVRGALTKVMWRSVSLPPKTL
jgi:hypothetical protein